MTLIKNFEQFVNENLNQKFAIFEDTISYSKTALPKSPFNQATYDTWKASASAVEFRKLLALAQVNNSGLDVITEPDYAMSLLYSLLKRGQATKTGLGAWLLGKKVTANDLVETGLKGLTADELKLQVTVGSADYIPYGSAMRTSGVINSSNGGFNALDPLWDLDREPELNQKSSGVGYVCAFVNHHNIIAFANGQGQYVLSQRLKEDGYMDFMSAADLKSDDTLYLYASKLKGQVQATKTTVETPVGGETAATGKYGAEFAAGSADLNPAVQAEVAKAADFVATKFPAGSVPDKFQLTSGASTEWGNPKKNYPQTSGTGPVANAVSDEQKNQDLAYRRGVAFANALNAKLKEKGHPGIDGFVVNWSIGRSGQQENPADRFIDLEVQKNEVAPKKKTTTVATQTGGGTDTLKNKAQVYEIKVSMVPGPKAKPAAAPAAAPAAPQQ